MPRPCAAVFDLKLGHHSQAAGLGNGARFHPRCSRMASKIGVGIIGCGKISDAYFTGLKAYDVVEIIACADQDGTRATDKAAQHGVKALSVAELLASPAIEIVVN